MIVNNWHTSGRPVRPADTSGHPPASQLIREITLARKAYESDTTRFIREFLQQHPEVVEKQRDARATWWDRPQDREQREKFEDARLPKKPYEYY